MLPVLAEGSNSRLEMRAYSPRSGLGRTRARTTVTLSLPPCSLAHLTSPDATRTGSAPALDAARSCCASAAGSDA